MNRQDITELEASIMEKLVSRRKLGAASYEAGEIWVLLEALLKIVQHLKERVPRTK